MSSQPRPRPGKKTTFTTQHTHRKGKSEQEASLRGGLVCTQDCLNASKSQQPLEHRLLTRRPFKGIQERGLALWRAVVKLERHV